MAKDKKFLTIDGNTAAAYSSYAFTEVASIFPITPSSPMADCIDNWSFEGRKNIFGEKVNVIELQSEGGAAGTMHGSLATGSLTSTYTASQGLLLMIPNMYKISGELLPGVFHVSARTLATHALSIFGDHSDVMACRQTGFAMLSAASVQEAADMSAVAHLSAIKGRVPFLHFFDGFRTSHEVQKIEVMDYEDLGNLVDKEAVAAFRERGLTPNKPVLRGSLENPDIYFQQKESTTPFYDAIPGIVEDYMKEITKLTGREYHLFNYYGSADAERIIIAMGSVCETIMETIDYLNEHGEKVGMINAHLYRPFSVKHFLEAIPKTVKKIAVLDRTKESGSIGEPLYLDVAAAYKDVEEAPVIVGGRYGLSSKDTTPEQIYAVYENLKQEEPKTNFTIGIVDDVCNSSLPVYSGIDTEGKGVLSARFWGLGSDGTVGANKNTIKIIGDHTDQYAQAYFSYDSKKSGGITISDLRFGPKPIRSTYLINKAAFVACHNQSYVDKYDMLSALKPGGSFLLNTLWNEEELEQYLPDEMKVYLAKNKINFYTIDAVNIAAKIGLGNRINTICQAAFFKITGVIPIDEAVKYMKASIKKSYNNKGDDIVNMNYAAVDAGVNNVTKIPVPEHWKDIKPAAKPESGRPEFIVNVVDVMNAQKGNDLPVSTFVGREDGEFPTGTTKYEKRGIAVNIPIWKPNQCIQCNQCSYVCPHAAIRPFLLTQEETDNAPENFTTIKGAKPYEQYNFRIQVSALDCTGCGSCVEVCPAKGKAIVMEPLKEQMAEADNWEYAVSLPVKKNPIEAVNVKSSQFEEPLLEFSGACSGCGETPYIKLLTQLFGDRMQIANASGCSSVWGSSLPSVPYTKNQKGHGPTWANSLFEDNAEYALGFHMGYKQQRLHVTRLVEELLAITTSDQCKAAMEQWLEEKDNGQKTREVSEKLEETLRQYKEGNVEEQNKSAEGQNISGKEHRIIEEILKLSDYLVKRSTWAIGGDGWAYDIGYGGLDHVIASGENVNIFVLDTEVYSNTGGQASKSTQFGAVAQFAAGGKALKKKDLGMMAINYGYVYVAQIAMGASQAQTLKAMKEAEEWDGPSIIIAYAPCINHGIRGGMQCVQQREKEAVDCGYWHLYRYNPAELLTGKAPFKLDSAAPKADFKDFLKAEVRYSSLYKKFSADKVEAMFDQAEVYAKERYHNYVRLENSYK